MTLYLIAFNDEWVPDLTVEELRERGTSGRAGVSPAGWSTCASKCDRRFSAGPSARRRRPASGR